MDAGSLKSLRRALAVGGVLGLLCTALMLVVNLAAYGHSSAAASLVFGCRCGQRGALPRPAK